MNEIFSISEVPSKVQGDSYHYGQFSYKRSSKPYVPVLPSKAIQQGEECLFILCPLKWLSYPSPFVLQIHIHRNVDSLGEHIPKEILPIDLGGFLQEDDAYDFDLPNNLKGIEQHFTEIAMTLKENL